MSQTPYLKLARIVKTRALNGEVMATAADGLPFCLYEGLQVWIVPPENGIQRQTAVISISDESESSAFICLDGYDNIDAAQKLVGRYLLAKREDVDIDEFSDINIFLGRSIIDENHGELGKIVEYLETPANDVLVVQGQYGEVLIPLIEQAILDIPEDESLPIKTHIMDGLIKQ